MNKHEFYNKVTEGIKEKLGEDFSVDVREVMKVNITLDGLTILHKSENISPTIYLKMLDLNSNVLSDFANDEVVYISEHQKIMGLDAGILFWANDEQMNYIREFEEKNGVLVYHAILTPFIYGKCLSLLYVSKYEEEWELEKFALRNGRIPSYVYNLSKSSLFGSSLY